MCFTGGSDSEIIKAQKTAPVERHQADASITKNSQNTTSSKGMDKAIKTTPMGLMDDANIKKKTLLGE